ncbi:MAG: DNA polymerase III subunit delta [Prevotella sp.]|nr:DNA polymerase III subunit delta [Prevotella sp.]
MRFDEVIGHDDAKERLKAMVAEGHLPHALLFCGPKGCGKMALAMAFASYLLCQSHTADDDSCGKCLQCAMLRKWAHPDLHFTYPTIKPPGSSSDYKPVSDDFAREWHELLADGPYFTLEQWLERIGTVNQQAIITVKESDEISHKLSIKSSQGGYKISLIWLPERMNAESANKLLKLIEEPPSHTVFLLVSEAPDMLLETIRSRTQRFELRRIDTASIEQALVSRRGIDTEAAHRIARISDGSWMQALDALDAESENNQFLADFIQMNRMSFTRNVRGMTDWALMVSGYGREKQKRMLAYFLRMLRESFVYNFHLPDLTYMTMEEEQFVKRYARFVNETNIIDLSELMTTAQYDIGRNANPKIVFFDVALQVTVLLKRTPQ